MQRAKPLAGFRIEEHFARWEFRAQYNLTASDAETYTLAALLELATPEDRDAWEHLTLGYRSVEGDPRLREAIAHTYAGLEADDILCFAGGQEGLWCTLNSLLGPDDHAIVTVPNYQSMESIPLAIASASGLALREAHDWSIDVDELARTVRTNTRLIAINFPNNPTGAVPDRATFDALLAVAAERELYVFSDEVYRGLESDPACRLPQVAEIYERGISLGVMSKVYGLPGLRLGWIACRDRELLARFAKLKHYLSICNPGPSELLARIALTARAELLHRNGAIVQANLALLDEFFAARQELFEWRRPAGSCVAFPRYLGAEGVERFCTRLVEEFGVFLLPSSIFESQLLPVPKDRFRIGFGRRDLPAALERLATAL